MRELAEPVDLRELIEIFYDPIDLLGQFRKCESATQLPEVARGLLDHHGHMTITVESYYSEPVDVRVARSCFGDSAPTHTGSSGNAPSSNWYAREITLHRHSDQAPVQYGIVRLWYDLLDKDVWDEIHSEKIPLGRALIEHDVLREVELCGLWEIHCGAPMSRLLNLPTETKVYGRTARIFCDHQPAIELLEVVSSIS